MEKKYLFRVVEFLLITDDSRVVTGNKIIIRHQAEGYTDAEKFINSAKRLINAQDYGAAEGILSEFKIDRVYY